jgi:acetoin:2,6-dichlorophenolindophenol oxidoreductase subunit beta
MQLSYLKSLNQALFSIFEVDESVLLLGEDIKDPYGGAFKVTRGLHKKYPDRVISTPISEAGITGVAAGMSLRGLKPIVEIMFGDFITLAADQIINGLSKFRQMYNFQVNAGVVVRTPMGGGRGYGPTHSQSIEKIFLGIPDLLVVSPSLFHDAGALLKKVTLEEKLPVLFVENKILYSKNLFLQSDSKLSIETKNDEYGYPVAIVKNHTDLKEDVILINNGGQSADIFSLLKEMQEEEINITACFPALISSVPVSVLKGLINREANILVVEEGVQSFGWATEVAEKIYSNFFDKLTKPISILAAQKSIIPAAKHLENEMLPSKGKIEYEIFQLLK